ncbi:MAG: HIT family protein [Gammaproteobacteria bacterium]|nr:HIT family protein [Gammaproteobacteria bacterium]
MIMAYDETNIFAKILRGEASAFSVYETDDCLAFLDVMPQSDGHTLVLPKAAAEDLFDLEEDMAATLIKTVQHVARGVREAFNPDGIRLMQLNGAAAGQTVLHFHMHVIPCYAGQAPAKHARGMAPPEILEEHAEKLRNALAR